MLFGMQFWSVYHVLCLCESMYPAPTLSISQHANLCIAFWLDIVIPFILYFLHRETEQARRRETLWGKWQMFTQSIGLAWKVKGLWATAAWTFELYFLMKHSIMFNKQADPTLGPLKRHSPGSAKQNQQLCKESYIHYNCGHQCDTVWQSFDTLTLYMEEGRKRILTYSVLFINFVFKVILVMFVHFWWYQNTHPLLTASKCWYMWFCYLLLS